MVDLLAQMVALQGQVANLQPGITSPTPAIYARTPALMGKSDLLDFRKKADLNVYTEGKSPILEGDKQFDVKTETLGPFLKKLHMKATNEGWNNPSNTQQIAMLNITHNGAVIAINITKSYGYIGLTKLRTQCRRFMTGADTQHQANQNNQMIQTSIWDLLTMRAQQSLTQHESDYTLGGVICGPLLLKVIIRFATMDSRSTISILQSQLNDIDSYAAGVTGDVEKIT
jgi:hypothetical protein